MNPSPMQTLDAAVLHAEFLDAWRPIGHPGQFPPFVDHLREAREAVVQMRDALAQISLIQQNNDSSDADRLRAAGRVARFALDRFNAE